MSTSMNTSQSNYRKTLRLPGWDYSQPGTYFITTVTRGRVILFGEIHDGKMHLNAAGRVVWEVWETLVARYPQITTGAATVMPNHFHGIIQINDPAVGTINDPVGTINDPVGTIHESSLRENNIQRCSQREIDTQRNVDSIKSRRRMTLPLVVGYFKMNSAKRINTILSTEGNPVWQRNYHEHIIRSDADYERVCLYIETNVENWKSDAENKTKPG